MSFRLKVKFVTEWDLPRPEACKLVHSLIELGDGKTRAQCQLLRALSKLLGNPDLKRIKVTLTQHVNRKS